MTSKVIINRTRFGDAWFNYHVCIIKKASKEEYTSFNKEYVNRMRHGMKEYRSSLNYHKECIIITFSILNEIKTSEEFGEFLNDILTSDIMVLANINNSMETKKTLCQLRVLIDTTSSEIIKNF